MSKHNNGFVTLEVVRELFHTQSTSSSNAFKVMFEDVKNDAIMIQQELFYLKTTLQFSQAQCEDKMKQVNELERNCYPLNLSCQRH